MAASANLTHLLGEIFDGAQDGLRKEVGREEYERRRRDFVFHMTDWEKDLHELMEIVDRPENWNEESASPRIIGFLYHVIPHLKAAGQLLLDEIPDAFADNKQKAKSAVVTRRTA